MVVSTGGRPVGARTGRSQRRQVLLIVALASAPLIALVLAGIWIGKVRAEAEVADERLGLARAGAQTRAAFVGGSLSTARSLSRTRSMVARGDVDGIERIITRSRPRIRTGMAGGWLARTAGTLSTRS